MLKKMIVSFALLGALLSAAYSQESSNKPPADHTVEPFRIMDDSAGALLAILVVSNGAIYGSQGFIGRVTAANEILDPSDKLIAKLDDSGTLSDKGGNPLVKISPDGTLDNGSGVKYSWSSSGEMTVGTGKRFGLVPNSAALRRMASSLIYLQFSIK